MLKEKQPRPRGNRGCLKKVSLGGLTLRELEALASTWLTRLLTLFRTWVTAKETGCLESRTELGIVNNQGTGNSQLDRVSLSVDSATLGDRSDIELVLQVCYLKWLEDLALESEGSEDVFEGIAIDADFAGSGSDPNAGHGSFSATGCGISFAHFSERVLEFDGLRFLGLVWMLAACIDLELAELGAAQLILGNHSLDGPLENELRLACAHLGGRFDGLTTDVTGVTGVDLVSLLVPGEASLLGIDDDNEVAGINVRCEDGLMFAAEEAGSLDSDFSDNLVLGIDDVPRALDVSWFC